MSARVAGYGIRDAERLSTILHLGIRIAYLEPRTPYRASRISHPDAHPVTRIPHHVNGPRKLFLAAPARRRQ